MKDILSPTYAFLDFDFSEFIDKNFDMSNDIFPNTKPLSPSIISSSSVASTTHLDDLFSDTGSVTTTKNDSNYILGQSPASAYLNNPLWSSIEELAYNTSKKEVPSAALSCIDTFIKDPSSDLVELVQQSDAENDLFQSLIINSLIDTPLPYEQQQQQHYNAYKQHYDDHQQQQQQQQQQRIDFELQQKYQQEKHLMELIKKQNYRNPPQQVNPPKKRKQQQYQSMMKRDSTKSTDTASYSSTNNSQYTHSDQVNAQLLKELIRQAGRNTKHPNFEITPSNNLSFPFLPPPDSQYTQMMNGNYPTNHNNNLPAVPLPPPAPSAPNYNLPNRYSNIPYKIQTNISKKPKQQKLVNNHHHYPYQRSASNNKYIGKPSMYSSDISQAQLLEIQAISRAQQDFIRAREQQEAGKGLLLKHHSKKAA